MQKTSLHQWFEYCTKGKKKNCPVCKQACSEENANRLYFQSIGDPNDTNLKQKPCDYKEDHRELTNEVKILEGKVLQLTSTLEKQLKDLKEVNAEVNGSSCYLFGYEFTEYEAAECCAIASCLFYSQYFLNFDEIKRIYMREPWSHEWHIGRSVSLSNILVEE